MYKIDRRGKGGGVKKSYIRKLPLVMYKIDRTGGGEQKIVTILITMIMLWVRQSKQFLDTPPP